MARASTYSAEDDLLIGDLPLGSAYNPAKYVEAASDEVDSYLGRYYAIPIEYTAGSVTELTLKRISNWLASGRLIMNVATAGQNNELHAYGWSLVKQAMDELTMILQGDLDLPELDRIDTTSVESGTSPVVGKSEDVSRVDTFYARHLIEGPSA